MTAVKTPIAPSTTTDTAPHGLAPGDLAPNDLAPTLQAVAIASDDLDADGYPEPGDIAADDVGASRLSTELNPAPEAERRLEKAP